VVADTKAGEGFTAENIRCIRPGFGLPPNRYAEAVGRPAARDLKRGEPLDEGAVVWDEAKTSP